jgi:hypothetical protein
MGSEILFVKWFVNEKSSHFGEFGLAEDARTLPRGKNGRWRATTAFLSAKGGDLRRLFGSGMGRPRETILSLETPKWTMAMRPQREQGRQVLSNRMHNAGRGRRRACAKAGTRRKADALPKGRASARDQKPANLKRETFGFRFNRRFLPSRLPASERWQSGRLYLTRNQACPQGYRGFESLPLRHLALRPSAVVNHLDRTAERCAEQRRRYQHANSFTA